MVLFLPNSAIFGGILPRGGRGHIEYGHSQIIRPTSNDRRINRCPARNSFQ